MKNLSSAAGFLLLLFLGLQAQEKTSVMISNADIGLVKEVRSLTLQKGKQTIDLQDIPQWIDPTSVLVESPDQAFNVLEQNYEFDLLNVDKILQKAIEQNVQLVHPDLGLLQGKLLSASSSNIILLDDEGKLQIVPRSDELKVMLSDYDKRHNDFVTRPTLVWRVDAEKSGSHQTRISYLTKKLNWRADYVAKLNEDDTRMTLACWVTIDNRSGKTYRKAKIKLLAGDIHLAPQAHKGRYREMGVQALAAPKAFEEKSFFEYHLYTLQWPATIKNNQVKQIQLFPETSSKIRKIFRVDSRLGEGVHVLVSMQNSKQNNLGLALPGGVIRLYKADGPDLQFIGEDAVKHTPKDEKIDIRVGKAFDVVAERRQIKSRKITDRTRERSFEYSIRNHKKKDIVVEVVERMSAYQEHKLTSSNYKPIETRAGYYKFNIPVKAGKESKLQLTYVTSW